MLTILNKIFTKQNEKTPNCVKNQQLNKIPTTPEQNQQRRANFEAFINNLQNQFVSVLQQYETKSTFITDKWERKDGNGGGVTCVLQGGEFFEKAGVNTSKIWFPFNKGIAESMKERGKIFTEEEINTYNLYANGISLVIHPVSPFIPTIHANYRWMELYNRQTNQTVDFWFGGGSDLTPHYLNEQDCILFHQGFLNACGEQLYRQFKKQCDDYFYIKFRNEHRGIGGIFFDDFLIENSWEITFAFVQKCGQATLQSYDQIIKNNQFQQYNDENMKWKQIRRGRYVEFNLVYDRGTKFGLFTPDARIESILMSLPHYACWEYMFEIKEGSEEEKMQAIIKKAKDWV